MSGDMTSMEQPSQLSFLEFDEKQLEEIEPDESFDYVIKRQRRKTMAVHVLADATVEVRIPKWLPKYEVVNFIEERSAWIIEQRKKSLQKKAKIPGYYHGQKHYFLGNDYSLVISKKNKKSIQFVQPENTLLNMSHWLIGLRDINNSEGIKNLLDQWYRQQAHIIFEQQMLMCFALFPEWFQQRYQLPEITIRKMRRRWGSCSSRGAVTLNLQLIKFPMRCINYVIIHELCHLEEFHHGKSFYRLLGSIIPDWKDIEKEIDSLASGD